MTQFTYEANVRSALDQLEGELMRARRPVWVAGLGALVMAPPAALLLWRPEVALNDQWASGLALALGAAVVLGFQGLLDYRLLPSLAAALGFAFGYAGAPLVLPAGFLPEAVLRASCHLSGLAGGLPFDLTGVRLQTDEETPETLFSGLLWRSPVVPALGLAPGAVPRPLERQLEQLAGPGYVLRAARVEGADLWLAFETPHPPLEPDWHLLGARSIRAALSAALGDLGLPLRLAAAFATPDM